MTRYQEKQSNLEFARILPLAPLKRRERLPTNTTTKNHSVHRWFNFIAGFSPEFVGECIDALPTSQRNMILDPFTGCGTTQVEGLRRGMSAVGYDPHPVFVRMARAKTNHRNALGRLKVISETIKRGLNEPCSAAKLGEKPQEFLAKLFDPSTLAALVGARNAVQNSDLDDDDLAFLVLSKLLDQTSHSQTDGIYKAPTSKKLARNPEQALDLIVEMIKFDLNADSRSKDAATAAIYAASCENMSEVASGTIDLVVTSPPYLNNFDFAEMTRMHLYFWSMASSWGEITDRVRSKLIVNTTTALKGHKEHQKLYRSSLPVAQHDELDTLVSRLMHMRGLKAGKKEYDYLVYPYFAKMYQALRESFRTMRKGGHFHMMVSDAALYGVHIPAPQIIGELMTEIGFRSVMIDQIRTRGERWVLDKRDRSDAGLGEYHIRAWR